MNNDSGTPSAQSEGTALPPPRLLGDMTTLTFAASPLGGGAAASAVTIAAFPASGCGLAAPLRAAILPVEPGALTITF